MVNHGIENNTGAIVFGGTVNARDLVGKQVQQTPGPDQRAGRRGQAEVAVLTVLQQEADAVVDVLTRHRGYHCEQLPSGQQAHKAVVDADGGDLRVVCMQATAPGQASATVAYQQIQQRFQPTMLLLVGNAGGIGDGLHVGDVVISDEIVYYDHRRETAAGPRRRGQAQSTTAVLRNRVNEFFRRTGGRVPASPRDVRVLRGPIGTGGAVITDAGSDIRAWLGDFNEKTLAVETEAGGVGQAFYERIDGEDSLRGWLTIRGISDLADQRKGHHDHQYAADRAALVMDRLLPLLRLTETR